MILDFVHLELLLFSCCLITLGEAFQAGTLFCGIFFLSSNRELVFEENNDSSDGFAVWLSSTMAAVSDGTCTIIKRLSCISQIVSVPHGVFHKPTY